MRIHRIQCTCAIVGLQTILIQAGQWGATDILDIIRTRVFAIVIVGIINKRFRVEVTNDMRRLKTHITHQRAQIGAGRRRPLHDNGSKKTRLGAVRAMPQYTGSGVVPKYTLAQFIKHTTHTKVVYYYNIIRYIGSIHPRGEGFRIKKKKNVDGVLGEGPRGLGESTGTIYTVEMNVNATANAYYCCSYYLQTYGAGVCCTCDSNATHCRMLFVIMVLLFIIIAVYARNARAMRRGRQRLVVVVDFPTQT